MVANRYTNFLHRQKKEFACSSCENVLVLPKDYEAHCSRYHSIDPKTTCVWCRQFSWKIGHKKEHSAHLFNCVNNYLNSATSTDYTFKFLNFSHEFNQKQLYDFESLPTEQEYEFIWPLDVDPSPFITYRDENLNRAVSYVSHYFRSTQDWFHVMIKPISFRSFVDALDQDRGKTRTLLFSCWCDGGRYKEARHRHHRHMIVVCPKGHFKSKFWPKVKMASRADAPCPNFPCKRSKEIVSPLHLVNTMGYLSHRKSKCEFSFENNSNKKTYKLHHFYMYRTLPIDFRLPLVLLWENGLQQLLYQEKFQNVSVPRLVENEMQLDANGRYKQKIKDFYKHERGLVLPVSEEYVPTPSITPHMLHLLNGGKLYFEKSYALTDDETWFRRQIEGGNCFYENVGDEFWVPRPKFQKDLHFHKPVVDENKKLKAENLELKAENDRLKSEKGYWKRKHESMESEIKSKQIKIEKLYDENMLLHDKIHKTCDEENIRLKNENEHLKHEIKRLKAITLNDGDEN